MKLITAEMIMAKNPCHNYSESRIKKLIGNGKTLLEILRSKIPVKDRIWVITRFLPDNENRKFAIWCARQANKNNISKIAAYIDAIEAYYVTGTGTKKQMIAADCATNCKAYWAADCAAERKTQIKYLRGIVMVGVAEWLCA